MAKTPMSCVPATQADKSNLLAIAALSPNAKGKPQSLTQALKKVVDFYIAQNNLTLTVPATPAAAPAPVDVKAESEALAAEAA